MADDYEYAPSDWWAQEEALAGPEAPSDWWAQEEAKAGPEETSDWFIREEALAGPEASFQDIRAAYPTAFQNTSSTSNASSPSLSGVASAIKDLGRGLLGDTQSAEGLLKLLLLGNVLKGYLDPKYGKPQPAGYKGSINMGLKASRSQIDPAPRAYGEGAKGQAYFTPTTYAAEGGIMGLAKGGRYLDGPTDGMADEINTSIDDKQPAKLSHGEFVIPADVVSHLGNGNSSAGAKVLYSMMEKVRKARTGNKKQGKQIKPEKFMPGGKKQGKQIKPEKFMPGGIAGYANGGAVAFDGGGEVPAAGTAIESNLASWAGPYVTDYLAKGAALANQPYEAYKGALTAGTSPLQQQAFSEAGNLPTTYQPTSFTNQYTAPTAYQAGQFDTGLGPVGSVQSYMNPYLQNVTDVQAREARRQSEIDRIKNAGRLTQAGAFGGSRQAIMEAEGARNLQTQIGGIQATGLKEAYDKALAQRLAESGRSLEAQKAAEESRQFGSTQGMTAADTAAKYGLEALRSTEAANQYASKYGLDALGAKLDAGAKQRAIEAEAVAAEKAAFEAQRADPFKKVQFMQSLIEGLPVGTQSTSANTSGMADLAAALADLFGATRTPG